MNISSSVATAVPTSVTGTPATTGAGAVQAAERSATAPAEKIGQEPVKLHFPWLSRLATKLEAVAENHWPFKSVPVAGENINDAA